MCVVCLREREIYTLLTWREYSCDTTNHFYIHVNRQTGGSERREDTSFFLKVHTKKDVCYKSLHSYKLETVSDGHRAQQCVMIKTTWTVCVCFVNLTKFCLICIVYASTAAFLCFDHARLQRICISVFFLLYYLSVACVEYGDVLAISNCSNVCIG